MHLERFTTLQVEAALCLWEAMIDDRDNIPELDEAWDMVGTVQMRHYSINLAASVCAVWDTMTEDERERCIPYDWEFVPLFLRGLTWTSYQPETPTDPRAMAENILQRVS